MRTFGAFIDWLLRNFLRLVIIAVIVFAGLSFLLQTCEGDIDKQPAKVEDTNFLVKTDSRNYYTDKYSWSGDIITLHGFWVLEGGKWKEYERDLPMPRDSYGKVEVITR